MTQLRLSPSGPDIKAPNVGDVLIWNGTEWLAGPQAGGGVLAGDANGPLAANEVSSLSPAVGGVNIALDDFTSDATEVRLLVRAPAGGPITSVLASTLGFVTEFDFILSTRADLIAVPGVGAGPVFTLPSGSYAIKAAFALDPGESMQVGNGVDVLMMGLGGTKVITGTPGAGPLLDVAAGGSALLYSMNLTNGSNGGVACENSGTIGSMLCRFTCSTTGGVGGRNNGGGVWQDSASQWLGGTGVGFDQAGGFFECSQGLMQSGLDAGLDVGGATAEANLSGCRIISTGGVSVGLLVDGASCVVRLTNCDVVGDGNGMTHTAGTIIGTGCTVTAGGGAGIALATTGGAGRWTNSNFVPVAGNCVSATGAGAYQHRFTSCDFFSTAASAVLWNAANADLLCYSCQWDNQEAEGDCLTIQAASTIQLVGGRMSTNAASRGNGLRIEGNIAGGLQVSDIHAENISTNDGSGEGFISYGSGTVRRCVVSGCDTATSVSTAINWPAASMPTLGLSIFNNAWDDPTPHNGFTSASARVNSKGNLFQTGLLTETAIVP
jgi:hypothetical protein